MSDDPNSLDFTCDWRFGFNLNAGNKGVVGYLLSWQGCGGLRLREDIEVWNPYDSHGQTVVKGPKIKCVGLLESYEFGGGDNDPMRLVAYVSKGVAADIRAKTARPLTSTRLQTAWYIIDFDPEKKQWYEASFIKGAKKVEANLDSEDGEMQIFVERDGTRVSETLDINVYRFEFQIVPAENKKATIEFATGPARRLVKQWGG